MARGSKKSYTSKQRRMASHIEDSEKKAGTSSKRAAAIAYATVNKRDGGGKKSGSGRKRASTSKSTSASTSTRTRKSTRSSKSR